MYKSLDELRELPGPLTFVFSTGFEDRVVRAPALLAQHRKAKSNVLVLTYEGDRHANNEKDVIELSRKMADGGAVETASVQQVLRIREYIQHLDAARDHVVVDITGFSRSAMIAVLSMIRDAGLKMWLIYTEADEYYPTREYFNKLTEGTDAGEAFLKLSKFESDEVIYSAHCEVEEIAGFEGRMLPNYPLMLITFLTFKRGRVSAILQAYEANVRVLIKGVPVREELKWRADAITTPNFDLIEDSRMYSVETLDWMATYRLLREIYEADNNLYRFNFMLAPLGSKMQTVGAWLFAKERPDFKLVTSTPKELYHEKYSVGFRDTFVVDNIPRAS